MPNFVKNNYLFISVLLIISSTFICLFFVENHSLIAHDELIYANRASLIIESGDWFTPFPEPHHKLVGSYWLTAVSLILFGKNEFAARLPSYILSLATIYIFYCLNKELINKKIAKLSALIISSSFLWFNFSHYCSPDILFVFVNILGAYFISKINSNQNIQGNYKLIFVSACLISFGFFVRSYMELLPLICLSPFIFYKIKFSNKKYLLCFSLGLIVGFMPSFINLFLAFMKYGNQGYLRPFSLLSQKTLEEGSLLEGFLFYPRNILLFNLPGIFFILSGVNSFLKFERKDSKLLFLLCPSIALVLLMLTASKYTHYLLFIIPWISTLIAFGIFESITNKNFLNKLVLNIFPIFGFSLGLILSLISILSLSLEIQILSLNIISEFIILFFGIIFVYFSLNMLLDCKKEKKFFSIVKILFLQILLFSYVFGAGIIGNPNNDIKRFIQTHNIDENKTFAIEDEIVSKKRRILSFYLKDYVNYDLNNLSPNNEIIHLFILKNKLNEITRRKTFQYETVGNFKDIYLIKLISRNAK